MRFPYAPPLRVFSSGWGRHSVAVLCLQILGAIDPYDFYVFANVGDKAENPDTLEYVRKYIEPLCKENYIIVKEVRSVNREGNPKDLYDNLVADSGFVTIPVRTRKNGKPVRRSCTKYYKVKPVQKEVFYMTRKFRTERVIMGIGFDANEGKRVIRKPNDWHKINTPYLLKYEFPLYGLGLTEEDCEEVIKFVGLPIPPKSSCWFCPFKNKREWAQMRDSRPDVFQKCVDLEKRINGKTNYPVYLHGNDFLLDSVPVTQQEVIEHELYGEKCETGYCSY